MKGAHPLLGVALLAALLAGCDERKRPTIPTFGELVVLSDPSGAEVLLDDRPLGVTTPAMLTDVPTGPHRLELVLTAALAQTFTWSGVISVLDNVSDTIDAALEGGCVIDCAFVTDRGRVRCRSTSNGDTCASAFYSTEPGLQWPPTNGGDYGAGGRLLVAAVLGDDAGDLAGDTVATQVYDQSWTGRSPAVLASGVVRRIIDLEYWSTGRGPGAAPYGLSVSQTIVAVDSATVRDVVFIRYVLTNNSADERYQALYPWIPEGGYTFRDLYVGFGFDTDVGAAPDDLGTFDPDLDLAFMYDADFQDAELGAFSERPALVGLVAVEPPGGATERRFTLWPSSRDWDESEDFGFAWRLLAGRLRAGDPLSDHPAPEIGHVSDQPADYRLTETHGPITLAPGASVVTVFAVAFAEPLAGTFVAGTLVPAGDPTDPTRPILDIAGALRELAGQVPELWSRYRP